MRPRVSASFLRRLLHERLRLSFVACSAFAQSHFLFAFHPIYPKLNTPDRPLVSTDFQTLTARSTALRPVRRLVASTIDSNLQVISTAIHVNGYGKSMRLANLLPHEAYQEGGIISYHIVSASLA